MNTIFRVLRTVSCPLSAYNICKRYGSSELILSLCIETERDDVYKTTFNNDRPSYIDIVSLSKFARYKLSVLPLLLSIIEESKYTYDYRIVYNNLYRILESSTITSDQLYHTQCCLTHIGNAFKLDGVLDSHSRTIIKLATKVNYTKVSCAKRLLQDTIICNTENPTHPVGKKRSRMIYDEMFK